MKKLSLSIFFILYSIFFSPSTVSAKVIMQDKGTVIIEENEVIEDDLFLGAENVVIDGVVNGDVYVGAGNVSVTGEINGALIAVCGNLTLSGASIGSSLVAGAGNVTVDDKSSIGRNAMIGAGTVYLNGAVGKEVRVGVGQLELGPSAVVAGDLTYALGEEGTDLIQSSTATVAGTVSRYTPPREMKVGIEKAREDFRRAGRSASKGWLFISFVGSVMIGFILLKFFPKLASNLSKEVTSSTLSSIGSGFFLAIFSLPTMLVLALTIIGIPLAGFLLLILLISLLLAKLVASYALGHFLREQFNLNKLGSYAIFFLGLAAFYLLRAIPPLGWLVSVLFTWAGLGALWQYARSHLKNH